MDLEQAKSECDVELLRGFVNRDLTANEEIEIEAHLEQCHRCRQFISDSAAEPQWWFNARTYLKRDELDEIVDHEFLAQHSVVRQIEEWLDPTDDPTSIGRFGGYEILGVVGLGGMGVVLKGFEPSLNRYVAVKVLSPGLATSGAARRRFAREAQAAAAVLHENVIAIHRVEESHGLPYLVMPIVSGDSLQKRIDTHGPLSLTVILRIAHQVAAGLAAAHAQGLVHRDIKPANILLDRGVERVTITDFGLARAADDSSLTRTGIIAGTPQYMSPEQARGESVGQQSDLFSLGSVLYAMCTGHSPFRAETSYGVLRRITDEEPRPIREINPEIPEWLCQIIARLMSKTPDERFESARKVAELLEACLAHVQQPTAVALPESVHNAGSSPRPERRHSSIGRWLAGVACGLVLLFAGIVIVLEVNKGTLTIESDDDDVSIRITRGDAVVEELTVTQAGKQLRIAAGTYLVEIEGQADGIVVENSTVTLKRGETEIVRLVRRSAADRELLEYPVHRIVDRDPWHVVSPPAPMDVIRELERHDGLEENSLGRRYENNPDDVRIIVERTYDKVDPPRHLPLVGLARLHRVRFKCTVYYTRDNERIESVVNIDADHLDVIEAQDNENATRSNDRDAHSHRDPLEDLPQERSR